jgi:hypothetical protein
MSDIPVDCLAPANRRTGERVISVASPGWIAAGAAMVLILIAPAVWNGFPIIFPDTGSYLTRPIDGDLALGRSALYGLFLYLGLPLEFWPNVIAQSALIAWLVALTLRAHGLGSRPWLAVTIMALLAFGSSLAWTSGQLLPDILFPAAVLAVFLLVFASGQLAVWERFALAGVIVFAITSHMAAAGLCVAVLAALIMFARLARGTFLKMKLTYVACAVAAGITLCPVSNWAITGTFAFTPGGVSFVFGRLVDDGIIDRYLHEQCPDPALRLCAYKDDMPDDADGWLWDPDSPFNKLHHWQGLSQEEGRIILATLRRYPLMHLTTAIQAVFDQLTSFQTEVSLSDNEPTIDALSAHAAWLMPRFKSARQQAGAIDVDLINEVDVPAETVATAVLIFALAFRRRLKIAPELSAFCLVTTISLFFNAVICGVFSHAVDRYQSRLMPLTLLAAILVLIEQQRRILRRRSEQRRRRVRGNDAHFETSLASMPADRPIR